MEPVVNWLTEKAERANQNLPVGGRRSRGRPKLEDREQSLGRLRCLQVKLTETGFDRIEKLRSQTDAVSIADVVRQALKVYEALVDQTKKGNKVYVESSDGKSDRIMISLL